MTHSSLQRSIASFTTTVSGSATLRVEARIDRGGLDASNLPRIAEADGVAAAVPLILSVVEAADGKGDTWFVPVLGVTCELEAVIGELGCDDQQLAALEGPLVGPGLRDLLGPEGAIHTDLGTRPITDAPVVDQLASINGGVVALYDLAEAQRELARPRALDAILVVPEPDADPMALRVAVEEAAGERNRVVDASAPITQSLVADLILPVLLLFALIGLVIGAQLVRNSLELTLEERRRELATVSALGASPRDMRRGILAEASVLGVLGGVLGIGLGVIVARGVVESLSDQVERAASGVRISLHVSALSITLGVVVGLGVCLLAAMGPARRAARRDLTAELSERARYQPTERSASRTATILTFVGIAAALALAALAHRGGSIGRWQQPAMVVAIAATSVLVFRVPALLVAPVLRAVSRLHPFATGPARVAIDELLSTRKRTSSVAMAIGAPVILAAALGSIVPAISTGAERLARQDLGSRVFVSTLGSNSTALVDSKVPPELEAGVAAVPGVERIEHWYYATIDHPVHGQLGLDGFDGRPPDYHVFQGVHGQQAFDTGRVMIGAGLARARGLRVGDDIVLPGRYGDVTVTVGGIWSSPGGVGREITVTSDQMRAITGPRPPERLNVVPERGVTPAELADRIRAADLDDRLVVLDPDELADDYYDEFSSLADPFRAMQRGVLVVALVATASTLLLSSIQRRREIGVLAALGMGPADLARSTLLGTLLAALTSGAIAAISSQAMVLCFSWASEVETALLIPYEPRVGAFPIAIATATLVALLGAVLPAWRATRADPIVALREA